MRVLSSLMMTTLLISLFLATPAGATEISLQLRVLRVGWPHDGDVGVGVFQECGKTAMELLLRQANLPHQLSKSRIGTQRVEQEIGVQTDQVEIALLISSGEPFESLIFVSQVGIELSNFVSRRVAGLALSLSDFNAFSQSALPAC